MFNVSMADAQKKMEEAITTTSKPSDSGETNGSGQFLSLPVELRQRVIANLSYAQISQMRGVSRQFNNDCRKLLDIGFDRLKRNLDQEKAEMKTQMPKRESSQRKHPLFRYSEFISLMKTRCDRISMTYRILFSKQHISFIPGQVLDEAFRVLKVAKETKCTRSFSFDIINEFRDLSQMAIEHFDEQIAPGLQPEPLKRNFSFTMSPLGPPSLCSTPRPKLEAVGRVAQLERKITELQSLVTKQAEMINALMATTSELIPAVGEISEWVDRPIDTARLLGLLNTHQSNVPGPSTSTSTTIKTSRKRRCEQNADDQPMIKKQT